MMKKDLSYDVVGCCMRVHSKMGPGLLEQCYHNALYYEIAGRGHKVVYNAPFIVEYEGHRVGEYFADLVVDGSIIIELKSVKHLSEVHQAQLINYLYISRCKVGLLVNFQGMRLEWKRLVV